MINYAVRLDRLRQKMGSHALLVEHPIDLFYLTGLELSCGKLLVTQEEGCLIVDGRYFEKSSRQSLYPVKLLKKEIFKEVLKDLQIHSLNFDQGHTTFQDYILLTTLSEELKKEDYRLNVLPVTSPVEQLRLIKDDEEIKRLTEAAQLGKRGFEWVVSLLQEGISEKELAFELEFFWKKQGASRLAFDPIIAFGANGSMPHYRAGDTQLKPNTSVLIDIGLVLDHYHSDMTRVVFFGQPSPLIQEIYAIVEEAKQRALALCRPGTLIGELDRVARDWIASRGYGEAFTHSLGHGVGLEIHEGPLIKENGHFSHTPLQAGMVVTIEPGIYLSEVGGVRLEDTIIITKDKYINITE